MSVHFSKAEGAERCVLPFIFMLLVDHLLLLGQSKDVVKFIISFLLLLEFSFFLNLGTFFLLLASTLGVDIVSEVVWLIQESARSDIPFNFLIIFFPILWLIIDIMVLSLFMPAMLLLYNLSFAVSRLDVRHIIKYLLLVIVFILEGIFFVSLIRDMTFIMVADMPPQSPLGTTGNLAVLLHVSTGSPISIISLDRFIVAAFDQVGILHDLTAKTSPSSIPVSSQIHSLSSWPLILRILIQRHKVGFLIDVLLAPNQPPWPWVFMMPFILLMTISQLSFCTSGWSISIDVIVFSVITLVIMGLDELRSLTTRYYLPSPRSPSTSSLIL